jgi:molybdopterin synthase catalytic subunit
MHLIQGPIDPQPLRQAFSGQAATLGCGAVLEFMGFVRADKVEASDVPGSKGRGTLDGPRISVDADASRQVPAAVSAIVYEAYAPMASRILDELEQAVQAEAGVALCWIRHSVGEVPAGTPSLWVGVASKHRAAGFDALRMAVERLKLEAPVWKWERFAEGEANAPQHGRWVQGNRVQPEVAVPRTTDHGVSDAASPSKHPDA